MEESSMPFIRPILKTQFTNFRFIWQYMSAVRDPAIFTGIAIIAL